MKRKRFMKATLFQILIFVYCQLTGFIFFGSWDFSFYLAFLTISIIPIHIIYETIWDRGKLLSETLGSFHRYAKGRRFEYRIKKLLEKHGWIVFRLAGSKPLDLIAFQGLKVYFLECKATPTLTGEEWKRLRQWSDKLRSPIMNVYRDYDGKLKVRKIHWDFYFDYTFDELLEGIL